MAGPPASATVKVDVRKLSAALNFVMQPHDNATCCKCGVHKENEQGRPHSHTTVLL